MGARRRASSAVAASMAVAFAALAPALEPASAAPVSWSSYHGGRASAVAASVRSVDTSRRAWTSRALDGQLYGEPLVVGDEVIVATENDTVYALSARTGTPVWSRHLGTAVPAARLACGNIAPTVGVTGTPVIDPARHEVFVVADLWAHGVAQHRLVGLDVRTGAVELSRAVDPARSDHLALLQRTGLALDRGRVVFGFGGNYGDCGSYRGRVVSVAESGARASVYTVDATGTEREGAVWMGGAAPVIDAAGHVWVSVGNGSVTSPSGPYDGSDSVIELSTTMQRLALFAPSTWAQDNASDADLSMAPALLGDGQVLVAGKSRVAYLLRATHLGGVAGQVAQLGEVCGDDVDGGGAVAGTTVVIPCLGGPVALSVSASPPSIRVRWSATVGAGPPVVTAGRVWSLGADGVLYGLDLATGALRQSARVGVSANHFATPGIGDGLMLVTSSYRVVAFRARG
jgi:outer membrane protein assembly factor BamB